MSPPLAGPVAGGATSSRWFGVLALLASNVLPLWLVLSDHLEVADLLLAYLLEAAVVLALWLAGRRRAARRGVRTVWTSLPRGPRKARALLGLAVVAALGVLWLWTTARAVLERTTWDTTTALSVTATLVSLGLGLLGQRRAASRRVRGGAVAWRVVLLFVGAVAGLHTADNLTHLLGLGWRPAVLGDAWAAPFGVGLLDTTAALGIAPAVLPALFVVVARTVHEVLYECYDVVRDAEVDAERSAEGSAGAHTSARL